MSRYKIKEETSIEGLTLFYPVKWDWYMPWWKPMFFTSYEEGFTYPSAFSSLENAKLAIEESKEESKKSKQKPIVKYHKV